MNGSYNTNPRNYLGGFIYVRHSLQIRKKFNFLVVFESFDSSEIDKHFKLSNYLAVCD